MNYAAPEYCGIKSTAVKTFVEALEASRLSTHALILARGNDIFFENYRKPFGKDVLHRMYSVSKSFVALAVGFAVQDGLLSLDDTMEKHFKKELETQPDINMRNQTVRHMLMMSTAKPPTNWFASRCTDRVADYFANSSSISRPSGTIFQYDSTGSFVLGALVERLTGMPFMEYLRIKLFDKIGVSKEAYCLKCPGSHSWGDSAILAKPRDLLLTVRFLMNGGSWNGEQLLDRDFVRDAVSKQIDNSPYSTNEFNAQGYGYLIWKTWGEGYFFNGMGCQFAVCVPEKDLIFIYNGDNQGLDFAGAKIFNLFYQHIVANIGERIDVDTLAQNALNDYADSLELMSAKGEYDSPLRTKVDGRWFKLDENPMGITRMRLCFGENNRFEYTNRQGNKVIHFGMGKNVLGMFPQKGYSREVGSVPCPGNMYKCAASAAWISPERFYLSIQITDDYLGRLGITFGFIDDDGIKIGIQMVKTAEDFLNEYSGFAGGNLEN